MSIALQSSTTSATGVKDIADKDHCECGICFTELTTEKVSCSSKTEPQHSFCHSCLTQYISNNFTEGGNTPQINSDGTLNCLIMGGDCQGTIELRTVLSVVDVDLKTRLLENYILVNTRQSLSTTQADEQEDPLTRHRNGILERLNLTCPNCQMVFHEFDGCLDVSCANGYGCGGHFCGVCFKFYGMGAAGSEQAHKQIQRDHRTLHMSQERMIPYHQLHRAKQIQRYLQEHELYQTKISDLFTGIETDIKDGVGERFYQIILQNGVLPASVQAPPRVNRGGVQDLEAVRLGIEHLLAREVPVPPQRVLNRQGGLGGQHVSLQNQLNRRRERRLAGGRVAVPHNPLTQGEERQPQPPALNNQIDEGPQGPPPLQNPFPIPPGGQASPFPIPPGPNQPRIRPNQPIRDPIPGGLNVPRALRIEEPVAIAPTNLVTIPQEQPNTDMIIEDQDMIIEDHDMTEDTDIYSDYSESEGTDDIYTDNDDQDDLMALIEYFLHEDLHYDTLTQLESLRIYIEHLHFVLPETLKQYEPEFIQKLETWIEEGVTNQLVFQFQQELLKKLSPRAIERYLGKEHNYDDRLFNLLQTRDTQRVTEILSAVGGRNAVPHNPLTPVF